MKKWVFVIILALFITGCQPLAEQQAREREVLIQRFQAAYPDTWQENLLEYDLQEQKRKDDAWLRWHQQVRQSQQNQQSETTHIFPDGGGGYIIYE